MPCKQPEIFISYSWNDEGRDVADDLERYLQEKGFTVMRDSRAIGYKGLIKEYMQRLGRGKCVILVLSDQYFKSPNCMYELLQIAQQSDFRKRIFPVVLDNTLFYRPEDRLKYLRYWDEEKTRLQEEIRQMSNLANLHGITDDLDLYDDIRRNIARLLDFLRNLNTYPLKGGNYEPLLEAIQANMPQAELDYSRLPIDFSSKIEFLTQYFVGRQDAMARIDQFIQTHRSGYLAIVGEAGIGKSALLAKLVKERGYPHHFVDDKQNSAKDEVFLHSIVGQLQQKYGFEFEERTPISVSEWNIYFHKWIKAISAEEQLVIFVDALDEAQRYGGSDNLLKYLPQELPENVYFIISSRPEFKKEDITFFESTVF
ncbi:TIR protein [Candidatus Vecturithrix granuli]|uniref:TIR protein n=1 Tax=Vecturithrix granuli TaxID=1499967 RepID=A0A081BVJ3_VECG1|nr:TIR protein [Candidatus Vecturithrix granuli]